MTGNERVRAVITGKSFDRQPIYGWLYGNLTTEIDDRWGSLSDLEDKYEFDIAHLFGGPYYFNADVVNSAAPWGSEDLTPDLLVDLPFFRDPHNLDEYRDVANALAHHKKRDRFCYLQTPGFFETFNGVFGIQNHLMWLSLYPDELNELYRRMADWTIQFVDHAVLDVGVDMIHISDDWGAQKDIMFSPTLWWDLIYPHFKRVVDHVHSRGAFCSVHSDGCIMKVADGLVDLGLDVVHPWQERANMSYDTYLEKYSDKFAILGGICVQFALGLMGREELEAEIRRVFGKLRGKRWIVCTSHFVQKHCSVDDLEFAYDLIYKLARE